MKKIHFTIALIFALCIQSGFAQQLYHKVDTSNSFIFHFRFSSHLLEKGYMDNDRTFKEIDLLFTNEKTISSLDSIKISATTSPEGGLEYNKWLARQRAIAIKGYIVWKYPNVDQRSIQTSKIDENWTGLRELIEADARIPSQAKVLAVIDAATSPATKKWNLKQIQNGESWRYIENNFLRKLRSGATCVILYKKEHTPTPKAKAAIVDSIPEPKIEPATTPAPVVERIKPTIPEIVTIMKPLFAIKTNMLADLLSCANIELEIPIGGRWSVSGELMTPWWRRSSSDWTMQILAGNGAVKYWFGDRTRREILTGWNLGLYGGGGKYDIQLFDKEGTQGEFFNAGLQAGYAHKIGKKLRLEYSVSLGVLRNNYKEYTKITDTKYGDIKLFEYPWETKRLDWLGPTNAKISLVWLLNYKTNKRGGKR